MDGESMAALGAIATGVSSLIGSGDDLWAGKAVGDITDMNDVDGAIAVVRN